MSMITKLRMRMLGVGAACTIFGAAIGGSAMAYQSHMWGALHYLQGAQSELAAALPDKGGHRAAAMGLVSQAISEVRAGIAVGAK